MPRYNVRHLLAIVPNLWFEWKYCLYDVIIQMKLWQQNDSSWCGNEHGNEQLMFNSQCKTVVIRFFSSLFHLIFEFETKSSFIVHVFASINNYYNISCDTITKFHVRDLNRYNRYYQQRMIQALRSRFYQNDWFPKLTFSKAFFVGWIFFITFNQRSNVLNPSQQLRQREPISSRTSSQNQTN